jgi:hypothetical protein
MRISPHAVSRWLERVRSIDPRKVVGDMRARGWHGPIHEDDYLWWIEHRLGLDLKAVEAEMEDALIEALEAECDPRPGNGGGYRLRARQCEFVVDDRQEPTVVTVLAKR